MSGPHTIQANFSGSTGSTVFSDYPDPSKSTFSLAAGPDGAIWFTEQFMAKIGRISSTGNLTEFPIAWGANSIAVGADGALWITPYYPLGRIGRITTAGTFTDYPLPTSLTVTSGITAGPDGALWFVEGSQSIGRITTSGKVTEYPYLPANANPVRIVTGPDGALWFTEAGRIGRITVTGSITQYPIPSAQGLSFITVGPDGALWFTDTLANKIGRITTSGTVTQYSVPTLKGFPEGIVAGADGALWFTENQVGKIGRITLDGLISEYAIPQTGAYGPLPLAIVSGSDGALWFTNSAPNLFGSIGRLTLASDSCLYSLSRANQSFPSTGGTGAFSIRTAAGGPAGCPWTATSNTPWITISSGTGAGNGTITYTVAANPSTGPRTGTITLASLTYTVTQQGTASAVSCTAAVPSAPPVAVEGRTELLGDYVLNCSGLGTGLVVDVYLTLNTNVTNRITNSTLDATLSVNGGTPTNAVLAGYSTLQWTNVQINSASDGTAVLRISGVRADASQLLTQGALSNPGDPFPTAVRGQARVDGPLPVPVNNPLQIMATGIPTLVFTAGSAANNQIPLVYQEANPPSFHGGATRLRALISNIPAGIQVYAPVYASEGSTHAQLYSADVNGAGGSALAGTAMASGIYQQLTVTNGLAAATWLVLTDDPSQIETFTFPLLLTSSDAVQVSGSLAPANDVGIASATAPIPRYRDFSSAQKTANLRVMTATDAGSGAVAPNTGITFHTIVENDTLDGSQTATNVVVQSVLPAGLVPLSCSASNGGTCSQNGKVFQAVFPSLSPHQAVGISMYTELAPLSSFGAVQATISASGDQVNLDLPASSSSASLVVAPTPPLVFGDFPASGSGLKQTFSFQFADAGGYQNIKVADVLINSALDGRHACYLAFVPDTSTLYLVDDAGDSGGPYQGAAVPGTGTIANGQCSVDIGASSVVLSGPNLTLKLAITFAATFTGNKVIYTSVQNKQAGNSNWQGMATWSVPGAPPSGPGVGGVSPASATNTNSNFVFTFTDTNGWQDISIADILVNSAIDGRHGCYLAFVPSTATTGSVYLVDDAGDSAGPYQGATLPASNTASNSQCAVNASKSSVTASGNTLTLTLNLTFTPGFSGNQIIYMAAGSKTANSGWQAAGSVSIAF